MEVTTAFKDADPSQLDRLVEGTTFWLASSNFKVRCDEGNGKGEKRANERM